MRGQRGEVELIADPGAGGVDERPRGDELARVGGVGITSLDEACAEAACRSAEDDRVDGLTGRVVSETAEHERERTRVRDTGKGVDFVGPWAPGVVLRDHRVEPVRDLRDVPVGSRGRAMGARKRS